MVHTFEKFQKLVDNAIMVEQARKEMGIEMKRKYESQGRYSNQCPHFGPPQGTLFQNQYGCPAQQNQQTPQTSHSGQLVQHPNFSQNRQNTPTNTPARNNTPAAPGGNVCFKCGEPGHYANACPKRNA
ncbi:cleavage and polyadenylation specificity factor subunit 4-like [Panicum virgatum]|uniref:cleavage and polyadenylation specificity factor subunit 4-like n=1 Tax=Panicum virgatum TaxID=38727 RepID=UPI0019D51B86|nr:cleavage and polyadenylation specificity factor subunit 4-like [Panicum virgatum]